MTDLLQKLKKYASGLKLDYSPNSAQLIFEAIAEIEVHRTIPVGVNVGVENRSDALRTAYRRGVAWARENPPEWDAYADKAAYDYADFHCPPDQPPSDVGVEVGVNGTAQNKITDTSVA